MRRQHHGHGHGHVEGDEAPRAFAARRIAWRRAAMATMALFAAAALVGMAVAPIRPLAFAPGELRTQAETVVLKEASGGEVAEIFTRPGAVVAAGAPVLLFDGAPLDAEIARLETRRAHLSLRRALFTALLDDRAFDPLALGAGVRTRLAPAHLDESRRRAAAERAEQAYETANFAAEIAETRAERASVEASMAAMRALIAALDEQRSMSARLAATQSGSRRAVLDAEARLAEARARLAELSGRAVALSSAVARLASEERQLAAQRRAEWSRVVAETETELADLDAQLHDAERRRARLLVVAPIDGRILELGARTAGDAVAPNQLVASIVPVGEDGAVDLIAEIRIRPADIGHVRVGDAVEIETSAFDREIVGVIEGTLISLSPSTLLDAAGAPYYRGEVALAPEAHDPDALTGAGREADAENQAAPRLAPGMRVTAAIALGETTLLRTVLKPIERSLDAAFSER